MIISNTMKKCVIAIDMGGTFIKYGVVSGNGEILFSGSTPASSSDKREVLLSRLCGAVAAQIEEAKAIELDVCGIAVSTPGPFDYAAGKSFMQGKYDSIYGVDLRAEFYSRAKLPSSMPIEFVQDAAAFLCGENVFGGCKDSENCACVTLGTGLGFACILGGKMLLNKRGGPYFVLAFSKYKDTDKRMEDIVSGTAILKNYGVDAKTLAEYAYSGDARARRIYYDMGFALGEALSNVPEMKKIDTLVIGGQISKSFDLMEKGLYDGIKEAVKICKAEYPEGAALIGAASKIFNFKE